MNPTFARHCTQTAFSLSLSRSAIDELFQLRAFATTYGLPMYAKSVEAYLMRRGLIQRPADKACSMNWVLSDAGILVCDLLREAGFDNPYEKQALNQRIDAYKGN